MEISMTDYSRKIKLFLQLRGLIILGCVVLPGRPWITQNIWILLGHFKTEINYLAINKSSYRSFPPCQKKRKEKTSLHKQEILIKFP